MAKRSWESSSPTIPGAERQLSKRTERSHKENRERAYIAASRRTDRSVEARVQSARMASEIHKERTGKGFKITEKIVMREEMYEEEDDVIPRHSRALASHLPTTSVDVNQFLNASVTGQVAIANLARQHEIDQLFAKQFPHAAQVTKSLRMHASPTSTNFHQIHSIPPGRGRCIVPPQRLYSKSSPIYTILHPNLNTACYRKMTRLLTDTVLFSPFS